MLSGSVLAVGRFLPAYWYIRANNMLAGFGKEVFDLSFYWKCIGIDVYKRQTATSLSSSTTRTLIFLSPSHHYRIYILSLLGIEIKITNPFSV